MRLSLVARKTFVVGAPLALAIVELFHPHPHELLLIDVRRWMLMQVGDRRAARLGVRTIRVSALTRGPAVR
jgi:hypothetical protein